MTNSSTRRRSSRLSALMVLPWRRMSAASSTERITPRFFTRAASRSASPLRSVPSGEISASVFTEPVAGLVGSGLVESGLVELGLVELGLVESGLVGSTVSSSGRELLGRSASSASRTCSSGVCAASLGIDGSVGDLPSVLPSVGLPSVLPSEGLPSFVLLIESMMSR
ncbi:MAG: hypothetical protein DWI09_08990 [Planctomycetota bacterium]|nr:MAG: hypothetical protein DWI09_08990 [Planctomycetota bacterium]